MSLASAKNVESTLGSSPASGVFRDRVGAMRGARLAAIRAAR
jgi:hypothetical protein